MPRLLILSQDHAEYKRLLTAAELPGLSIVATHDPADTIPCSAEFDLLMGEPALISQVVNCLPELRWAQCTWAGVEPLLRPGVRRDYTLTNVRHVYGSQMSEYVFGYLLLIERGMLSRWQAQQERRWDTAMPGTLRRKTLGLMGVGSIGAHLAGTARHFSMHVRGYTRFSESCPDVEAYFHGEALSEFAAGLDYLVCVLPGTSATRHLVDASLLAALPPHAWLVNIGRGTTRGRSGAGRGAQRRAAGRRGAGCLPARAAAPRPSIVAYPQHLHHCARGGKELPAGYRQAVLRELHAFPTRRGAARAGGF